MKKLLVILSLALAFSAAGCSQKKDDTKKSPATDLSSVYSDAAINEIKDYIIAQNPGVTDKDLDPQILVMKNTIKAAENIGADLKSAYDKAINAEGVKENIDKLKSEGMPESYVDFDIYASVASQEISAHMEKEGLFDDVDKENYFKENYWRAKHVLRLTEGLDESQKADALKLSEEILKRAESGEDFDALVAEYSEDPGSKSELDGYVFTTGKMVPEFEEGTKTTPIGKFTLVETSYGYHVIQRLALDETPELYDKFFKSVEGEIESAAKQAAMQKFIEENA